MKVPLAAAFILGTALGTAQSWCAPGARWHHEYPYTSSGDHGYVETSYTGHVLFADSVCEAFTIIEHGWSDQTNTPWQGGPFLLHTYTAPDGSVYSWDGSAFDTLFHFTAVPGDHWNFPTTWWEEGTRITVTDTGHTTLGGLSLRFLAIEATLEDIVVVVDTIFERIGPIQLFLDVQLSHYWLIDGGYGALRCYADEDMELIRVAGPCEIALGLEEARKVGTFAIYPNPASTFVVLEVDLAAEPMNPAIVIQDITGRVLKQLIVASEQQQLVLDSREFAPGTYNVVLTNHDSTQLTKNLVIRQ